MSGIVSLPRIMGHRGAAASAPENTLAGIRQAAAYGAVWVEFDVKLTADGIPVLMHDDSLKRTTGKDALASELSLADFRALDAGSWFGPEFAGETVPSLEETLGLLRELDMAANIEIKPSPGEEADTVTKTIEVLERVWPATSPAPLMSSFSRRSLEALQKQAPKLPRGYLVEELPDDWSSIAKDLGCVTIHHYAKAVTARQVTETKAAGYGLAVYTVNDPEQARELLEWGIDCLITDAPDVIAQAIS
ncbi:glycerophosphodiester phosphodiesterase [Pelagibius sp. Alg239-R121]|uniref:glycerophosphodiester phosphodiesterase n=1 Tax=Pelagibius sp. Alg239-R121 TaxID=2993448 RepID=UPI0024A74AC1|nr:glycerophosphodiester phosphodiesterase [Pelagibius sp. Alg239-R121]